MHLLQSNIDTLIELWECEPLMQTNKEVLNNVAIGLAGH